MDETNDQRSNTAHVASGVQQSCSKTSVVSTGNMDFKRLNIQNNLDIEQLKFFSGNPHVECKQRNNKAYLT